MCTDCSICFFIISVDYDTYVPTFQQINFCKWMVAAMTQVPRNPLKINSNKNNSSRVIPGNSLLTVKDLL